MNEPVSGMMLELVTSSMAYARGEATRAEQLEVVRRVMEQAEADDDMASLLWLLARFSAALTKQLAGEMELEPEALLQNLALEFAADDGGRDDAL